MIAWCGSSMSSFFWRLGSGCDSGEARRDQPFVTVDQKKSEETRHLCWAAFKIAPVTLRSRMIDPVTAVADSLQALRNGTTDEQWNGLKADPLVRDLIGRCADLEAALLLGDEGAVKVASGKTAALKSAVDSRLLLAA